MLPDQGADPLAQLRDIHIPDSVSWWPPAPGWWGLVVIIFVAMVLVWLWRRRRRQRSCQRAALCHLEHLEEQYRSDPAPWCASSPFSCAGLRPSTIRNWRVWRGENGSNFSIAPLKIRRTRILSAPEKGNFWRMRLIAPHWRQKWIAVLW